MYQVVMLYHERLPTGLTSIRAGHAVRLAVLVQIVLAREAFAAHLALVHLFACMGHGVPDQVFLPAECLSARGAHVRALAGVQLPVLVKVLFSLERLATNITTKRIIISLQRVFFAIAIGSVG